MKSHRNSQKRIYIPDAAYFITVKTLGNYPYFKDGIFCDLFVEQLRVCKRLKEFELYGWFLGYDHFHLVIRPIGEWNYSEIMFSIKKQFSHNVNIVMGFNPFSAPVPTNARPSQIPPKAGNRLPAFGGDDSSGSRLRPEFQKFAPDIHRLDSSIVRARIRFILKYDDRNPFPKFRWQESFRDHYIRGESDLRNNLWYIMNNPIKHKLPKNWPYIFTNPKFDDLHDSI
jgi:REP element-mobilizing transposase RayT